MSYSEESFLPWLARQSAEIFPPRRHRCFRTTVDGRIALMDHWPTLLARLKRAGKVAIQTRHAYARLIAMMPVPLFVQAPGNCRMRDETGSLQFDFTHWRRAWGRLGPCECCASPGRIEVCNAQDLDFLQFAASPSAALGDWSDLIGLLVGQIDSLAPITPFPPRAFPRVPARAIQLPSTVDALGLFLAALGHEGIPLCWTLRTPEFCHTREFVPRDVEEENRVLFVGAGAMCVQIALPGARYLAVDLHCQSSPLYVAAEDGAVLLTISAVNDADAAAGWRVALHAAFPILSH